MNKVAKKVLCGVCALTTLCAVGVGCDDKEQSSGSLALEMGVKYYLTSDMSKTEEERDYYIFHKDGTGEYYYCYKSVDYPQQYTVSFIYTVVDKQKESVACFYDGVEYGALHPTGEEEVSSTWTQLLMVSENFLRSTGGSKYVSEEYLSELPNFGK